MLYIMRHGITDWNEANKLQGRSDVPLNARGIKMAEDAAYEYRDVHFDTCYCSPLIRAKKTAEILLKDRDVPIITDERLSEMAFGVCEGMKDYFTDQDSLVSALFHEPEKYLTPPEGAESFEELFQRTGAFLQERIKPELAQGKDILIVGHGAMNTSIICRIREIPLRDFWSVGLEQCRLLRLI